MDADTYRGFGSFDECLAEAKHFVYNNKIDLQPFIKSKSGMPLIENALKELISWSERQILLAPEHLALNVQAINERLNADDALDTFTKDVLNRLMIKVYQAGKLFEPLLPLFPMDFLQTTFTYDSAELEEVGSGIREASFEVAMMQENLKNACEEAKISFQLETLIMVYTGRPIGDVPREVLEFLMDYCTIVVPVLKDTEMLEGDGMLS